MSVRHWDIHGAVVCIPGGRLCMHVRVDVQMSCVDGVNVLLGMRVCLSETNTF